MLAAVVDAASGRFVHNFLMPKTAYEYRVAGFNAHGKSPFTETGAVTTVEAAKPFPAKKLAPCTKLGPEKNSLQGLPRYELTVTAGVTLISEPSAKDPDVRILYGQYQGCVREMGRASLQGDPFGVREWTDEGFPLLRGVRGAGEYVGAQVSTYAFSSGRYEEVNEAMYCGEPWPESDPKDPPVPYEGDELTSWRGPFETCQRDFPKL